MSVDRVVGSSRKREAKKAEVLSGQGGGRQKEGGMTIIQGEEYIFPVCLVKKLPPCRGVLHSSPSEAEERG